MTDWLALTEEQEKQSVSTINWEEKVDSYDIDFAATEGARQERRGAEQYIEAEEESEGADFGTLIKAGIPDDPKTRLKIFADARGIPKKDIDKRFRIEGEDIQFKGEDGKWRSESPSGFMGGVKEFGADIVSHSPELVMGTAGAIAGTPGGFPGMAAGGALGAAGGEGYRKSVASILYEEPQTVQDNLEDMGAAGAWAIGGELTGVMLGKGYKAVKTRRAAKDIDRLDKVATDSLEKLAKEQGIQLTPSELTGLRSMITQQWLLGSLPGSSDIIESFLKNREGDIQKSVYGLFDKLAKEQSPFMGYKSGVQGAKKARERLVDYRHRESNEIYKQAFKKNPRVDMTSIMDDLNVSEGDVGGSQLATLEWVKNELKKTAPKGKGMFQNSRALSQMHGIKLSMDARIEGLIDGTISADKADLRMLQEYKEKMLDEMDNASPLYTEGNNVFEELSGPINNLDEHLVGGFVKYDDDQVMGLSTKLFGPRSSPELIGETREIISAADPESWNSVVRAHLQDAFEKTREGAVDVTSNIGGIYRKAVFGTERKRKMLRSALGTQQYAALDDMMTVLDATGRSFKGQSITIPAGFAAEEMKEEAIASGSKLIRGGIEAANILSAPRRIKEAYEGFLMGSYNERMAEIITDKDAMARLRKETMKLRQVSPKTEKGLAILGTTLGIMLGNELEEED